MFWKSNKYWVLELMDIVDEETAISFPARLVIENCLNLLSSETNIEFDDFELNYGAASWKTLAGLQRSRNTMLDDDVVSFMCFRKVDDSFMVFNNQLLNDTDRSNRSELLTIRMALSSKSFDSVKIKEIVSTVYNSWKYKYGYAVELSDSYNFLTEKKTGFFTKSDVNTQSDIKVQESMPLVFEGSLKKLYPINYLNKTHLTNETIKSLLDSRKGSLKKLDDNISIWSLEENDIPEVDKVLQEAGLIIDTRR